ncbi:hypothetical protein [Haloarcula onubensis]|uniref:Small CPxCG-related zinc finger protein n=1 Tax=Haloarcula onubensis TaxID=2950539 RepID=A0ABU2FNN9_9EURY|nr:hypothetical protein [Halomicroarcula sp. S3CR25-11]MDS0281872.1 hypothetical protein [Halomicroarcula sp. S3CR25-11]
MENCDNCNDEVGHVWKYRRPTETMTYWREERRCASCHPRIQERFGQAGT